LTSCCCSNILATSPSLSSLIFRGGPGGRLYPTSPQRFALLMLREATALAASTGSTKSTHAWQRVGRVSPAD
jgi:hypothetical protein